MLALEFKLKPSKHYLIFLFVLISASTVIIQWLTLSIWLKAIGMLFIVSYGGFIFWKFGLLRSQHSIISLKRANDGSWLLYTQTQVYQGELRSDSTLSGVVSVLRFRALPVGAKSCIIFRDSLDPDRYRQLLVALKMR